MLEIYSIFYAVSSLYHACCVLQLEVPFLFDITMTP
jgi:hypothetical protein